MKELLASIGPEVVRHAYGSIVYEELTAVDPIHLAEQVIPEGAWLAQAASVQLCPIVASEFSEACRDYPVVFMPGEVPLPVAVLSFTEFRNPFVIDGRWRPGRYVPAALRRYPFCLGGGPAEGQRPLCIDLTFLKRGSPMHPGRLFVDEKPTRLIDEALKFCVAYEDERVRTEALCARLLAAGLFTERRLQIKMSDGAIRSTAAFNMIDESALQALPETQVVEFHRDGVLRAAYSHQNSLGNAAKIAAMS